LGGEGGRETTTFPHKSGRVEGPLKTFRANSAAKTQKPMTALRMGAGLEIKSLNKEIILK
jgi:hypothetical protein